MGLIRFMRLPRFMRWILGLDELKSLLGFSVLEATEDDESRLLAEMFGSHQLSLFPREVT